MAENENGKLLAGGALHAADSGRCQVCALPLPAGPGADGICSRRCAGRRGESAAVALAAVPLKARMLETVAGLRAGTTICPGELAQRVWPGVEAPLTLLRPLVFELAAAGKIRLRQQGTVVHWEKIRGPFRVGK